jgi:quercetin dioxygenase-like cupin family protein
MQRISLEALARQQFESAARSGGGHTADTVYGGREKVLRRTVIGMVAGAVLGEHDNPGEATVQVLRGRIRLSSGDLSGDGRTGDMIFVPDAKHSVLTLEDSALLLTVAKSMHGDAS